MTLHIYLELYVKSNEIYPEGLLSGELYFHRIAPLWLVSHFLFDLTVNSLHLMPLLLSWRWLIVDYTEDYTRGVSCTDVLHNCAVLISDIVHQVLLHALQQSGEIDIFIPEPRGTLLTPCPIEISQGAPGYDYTNQTIIHRLQNVCGFCFVFSRKVIIKRCSFFLIFF